MLYNKKGYAGIQQLESYLKKNYKQSSNEILRAFKLQEVLDKKLSDLSQSLGLTHNSPQLMTKFFSEPENRHMALKISMDLVYHEQKQVQEMYTDPISRALTNPVNIAMGSFLHLDGVKVNGKRFSFSEHVKDPSNFEQRMAYFKTIFTEISNLHADPKQMHSYHEQVRKELYFSTRSVAPQGYNKQSMSLSAILEKEKFQQQMKSDAESFITPIPKTNSENLKNQRHR